MKRRQRRTNASTLTRRAGRAHEPMFDALEERKLLATKIDFTLDPNDPFFGADNDEGLATLFDNGDGTFTAQIDWAYLIPYLAPPDGQPDFQAGEPLEEMFDDAIDAMVGADPIFNGEVIGDNNFQVFHNLNQIAVIQNFDIMGEPIDGSQRVLLTLDDPDDFATLGFLVDAMQPELIGATSVSMFISDGVGLNTDDTRVELLARGEVIASFTGQALRDLNPGGGGIGTFTFTAGGEGFDQIRFVKLGGGQNQFSIDNIVAAVPGGTFAELVNSRTFGARMSFTAPAGASVRVFDLQGNLMNLTLRVGSPPNGELALADLNDDGIPEINDGIGRVEISGTDSSSTFALFGGTIEDEDGALTFNLVEDITGLYDDFEEAGFGYIFTADMGMFEASGLPGGPGSVILGSPFVRDVNDYNPGGFAIDEIFSGPFILPGGQFAQPQAFNRADQGIFVLGGSNIAEVYVHGVVHGTSQLTGFADRVYFGYMPGSLSVAGDLGSLTVGADAGSWTPDPDFDRQGVIDDAILRTSGQLVVGRTLGQVTIGGRSLLDVTVVGDLGSPSTAPPRDTQRYVELERALQVDPTQDMAEEVTVQQLAAATRNFLFDPFGFRFLGGSSLRSPILADSFFRNDSILSAEFVSNASTSVQISGNLGLGDAFNTDEDNTDVFAFAVDGTSEVVVEINSPLFNLRIMDQDGRTLRALEGLDRDTTGFEAQQIRFAPPSAGVYYLVVGTQIVNQPSADTAATTGWFDTGIDYSVIVTGMAPVTMGAYRTVAGSGSTFVSNFFGNIFNTVNVLNGSIGSLRVGTGLFLDEGEEGTPSDIINQGLDDDDILFEFGAGSYSTRGDLWNITTGSDIGGFNSGRLDVFVDGNFGNLVTGLNTLVSDGEAGREGDVEFLNLVVGGTIASLDIRGSISINGDDDTMPSTAGLVTIRSGDAGGPGHIGLIRTGGHIQSNFFRVETSPGSVIDAFLVSQDIEPDFPDGTRIGLRGGADQIFTTGADSDLRFADFPQIDLLSSADANVELIGSTAVEFVDDAGGRVRIQITGGVPNAGIRGLVRFIPIDGSEGVAVAQIEADLTGGAVLNISSFGTPGDVISIGRVEVTQADAQSGVRISGIGEIDVWQIQQTGGDAFDFVENLSAGGDIYAVDVVGLNRINILDGDLGHTQTVSFDSIMLAPFLDVQQGEAMDVGGIVGLRGNDSGGFPAWNGTLYRPVDSVPGVIPAFGDDVGVAMNPFLAGAVVRTGSVQAVSVGGSVRNFYLQGGAGATLTSLVANADRQTTFGEFDGITGVIYADIVQFVNVGDGLVPNYQSPILRAGVIAADDVRTVVADIAGANISGVIGGADVDPTTLNPNNTFGNQGIDTIRLTGAGDIVDAVILTGDLHGFWNGNTVDQGRLVRGSIANIISPEADIFRSQIDTGDIGNIELTEGFIDASFIDVFEDVQRISVAGFRNSTIGGSDSEFAQNIVQVAGDVLSITATADIRDTTFDIVGSITQGIEADNIIRSRFDIDNFVSRIETTGDLSGSSIVAGQVDMFMIGDTLATSTLRVSGPIEMLTAETRIINTNITVTGPDGRIDMIETAEFLGGSVTSSGPIDTIMSTAGDLNLSISTTRPRGTVGTIEAARDLNITTDIQGAVTELIAGRHVGQRGDPRVILIKSDLESITAGGQLYSDLRVGQSISEVALGRVANRPGDMRLGTGLIEAFDRIELVQITGDFDGSIRSFSNGIGRVEITDGSFLSGNIIEALDGNIDEVLITSGNLYGDIHADYTLFSVRIVASADGIFGDIGVNPDLDPFAQVDGFRNQLPPGVGPTAAREGPRITAGWNIGFVTVENGSIFEATIFAERSIGIINVNGDIRRDEGSFATLGTAIVAGFNIFELSVSGMVQFAWVIAGVTDLGADMTPGGTGDNADTNSSGFIETVNANDLFGVVIAAGTTPGSDGLYNTGDDLLLPGVSFVRDVNVPGTVEFVGAVSEAFGVNLAFDPRFVLFDQQTVGVSDPDVATGPAGTRLTTGVPFAFTRGTESGTLTFTGDGAAFWDEANGRVILNNTNFTSALTVTSTTGLTDFLITTTNNASVNRIDVQTPLRGSSKIVVDAFAQDIITQDFDGTGGIVIGENANSFTTGNFTAAQMSATNIVSVNINGDYGSTFFDTRGPSGADFLAIGFFNVAGDFRGRLSVEYVALQVNVTGAIDNGLIRMASAVGDINAASVRESRVSIRDFMTNFNVTGDVFDTSVLIGGDLGPDADYDRFSGADNDEVSSGFAAFFDIGGDFIESDIIGGGLRGPDGFHGTDDDVLSQGRSIINSVIIGGNAFGSNLDTESYRINSTGNINLVTVSGVPGQDVGNFEIGTVDTAPLPIRVNNLVVSERSLEYTARLFFNQPMDASTFSDALTVSEIRGASGEISVPLTEGTHYRLVYEPADRALAIIFNRSVTTQDLPQTGSVPGPGVYRFELDQDVLRAALAQARLDGNGDSVVTAGDNYSQDDIVGDAGDKLLAQSIDVTDPVTNEVTTVDFYTAANLDIVLDSNVNPDGLADANRPFTIRGTIGDHPDNDPGIFRFAGDVDLYSITLEAGQILRVGAMTGSALFAGQFLIGPSGFIQPFGDETIALPSNLAEENQLTFESNFLIQETGTYIIAVSNVFVDGFSLVLDDIPNPDSVPGGIGDYAFSIEVFDDGNSGFGDTTDAGNGDTIVNAPDFPLFAGNDGILGTADDIRRVTRGSVAFTFDAGPDALAGTSDDMVIGDNGSGIVSMRFADGRLVADVDSAIGDPGFSGVPGNVSPDVDIYHLDNRRLIEPGTRIRATVKVSELGGDLGSRTLDTFVDFSGDVQFALFDTTNSTSIGDADLVFSPTAFTPNGGVPGTTIADDGTNSYGFDDNGDFFIEFVTPQGDPAKYALYIQGAFNSEYQLEVVTFSDTGFVQKRTQNVVLELNGGEIDWLETGGLITSLAGFDLASVGFNGTVPDGRTIDQFVIDQVLSNLTAVFANAGLDVRFSTNPADFEFQDFSTVFLSTSSDPLTPLNPSGFDAGFNFFSNTFDFSALGNPFGYSEGSDALNTDRNDEAVVFVQPFGLLNRTPSETDLELFAQSLTSAVGRRVGELMGLRITDSNVGQGDILASDAITSVPGVGDQYFVSSLSRDLSSAFDSISNTDFYLGRQNAAALLGKLINTP